MYTVEDVRDVQARQNRWTLDYLKLMFETAVEEIMFALGQQYFWNLPPRERAAIYANYPPMLTDGTIPGPGPDGKWDWAQIKKDYGDIYRRHLEDQARLTLKELKATE